MTADLFAELSAEQETLLKVIFAPAKENGEWPTWQYVDTVFSRTGSDTFRVLCSLPALRNSESRDSYGLNSANLYNQPNHFGYVDELSDHDEVDLTIAAALHLLEFAPIANQFLNFLRFFVDRVINVDVDPLSVSKVTLKEDELDPHFGSVDDLALSLVVKQFDIEPISFMDYDSNAGVLTLHRDQLKLFHGVVDIADYVQRVVSWVDPDESDDDLLIMQPRIVPASAPRGSYIQPSLLDRLEAAQAATKWNLKKLHTLAVELNESYALGHAYASHTLLRAIIDHVPPVFGKGNFKSVVEQYCWSVTDKKYMKRLEDFRGQGDDALHRMIREREDILDIEDIPSRVLINRLIDEVVALLEAGTL